MTSQVIKVCFLGSSMLASLLILNLAGLAQTTAQDNFAQNKQQKPSSSDSSTAADSVLKELNTLTLEAYELARIRQEEGLKLTKKIQDLAEAVQNKKAIQEALYIRYVIHKKLKQDSLAYLNLQASLKLKRAIEDSTNELSEESIRNKYSIEQREKEITLLKNQKQIQHLQIRSNKMIITIILPAFIMLCLVSLVLWKQYKRKKTLQLSLSTHHTKIKLLNEELRNINNELVKSEIQLKEINETKDKFFSVVSQDLKSPLSSLSTFLKNFIGGSNASEEHTAEIFVKRVNESVTNLSMLINNLLEWSRLQTGSMEFRPEKLCLKDFIEENIILIKPQAENKDITISIAVPEELTTTADKQMIGFVFRILVGQLIDADHKSTEIKIEAYNKVQQDRFIDIHILSSGLEELENEFAHSWDLNAEYLKSSEKSRNRGLGLILCKEFIEKHGGTISFSDKNLGGKAITFTLPGE